MVSSLVGNGHIKRKMSGMLSFHQGGLGTLYAELCELERKMNQSNPGMKSCYNDIARRIREHCAQFTNLMAAAKIHLPKPAPKPRGKGRAKGKGAPPVNAKTEEEEEDE